MTGRSYAERLARLQAAMRAGGFDLLLLGSEPPGLFAAGHTRIGVQMPASPIPVTVVPAEGDPHVVTPDPDGALNLPADHVHPTMWNPAKLASELPRWLEASGARPASAAPRVGVDSISPGGVALVEAALPGCQLLDASVLLARTMMAKDGEEVGCIAWLCGLLHDAARAGLEQGPSALADAMKGAFPLYPPRLSQRWVSVAARRGGLAAEARLGPGDPGAGTAAVAALEAGAHLDRLATLLPPGVELVGIGRGFEPPLVRNGLASPAGLKLQEGAVLCVRWDRCAVTVQVGPAGPTYLSPPPEEVVR